MRKAREIHLFDCHEVFAVKDDHWFEWDYPHHTIMGHDLVKFLRALGVEATYPTRCWTNKDGEKKNQYLADEEFGFYLPKPEKIEVASLSAEALGDVLELLIEWGNGSKDLVTYHGKFFVVWKDETD